MGYDRTKRRVAISGKWVPVGLEFLRSRACAELSTHAAKLLLDVLGLLGPNAARNGDICITPKTMRVRGWSGRETLNATVRELEAAGMLAKTRQGGRLDCNLYAVTFYPLDCDQSKLDATREPYTASDWQADGADAPTEARPARWRKVRKTDSLAPPRDAKGKKRPATGRTATEKDVKKPTSSRHGTKPPVFEGSSVPPRVTYLDKPSMEVFGGVSEEGNAHRSAHRATTNKAGRTCALS